MTDKPDMPWCEKHRASCFADVKGQDFAIEKVKLFLKTRLKTRKPTSDIKTDPPASPSIPSW